jgi:hypothetical protein
MNDDLACWKCGSGLSDLPRPLGRLAECPACHAELHVCRMCRHYDTAKAKHCREPMAEEVKDKARANFCEWFQPRPNTHSAASDSSGNSRAGLDALFGGDAQPSPNTAETARKALDDLFGGSE